MKHFLFLLIVLTLSTAAEAQFFGGYADGVTSAATGKNTIGPALRMVYDDFTFDLPGNIISFEMIGMDNTGSPVGMYYEIRTGVSEGNGGTVLFSGTQLGATVGYLPVDGSFGTPPSGSGQYGWYDGGPTSTIALPAGTYWIGMAPLESFGHWDVTSTVGFGSIGHPINDGNAFYYDSSNPALNFASMGANDFGLRIFTDASTAPEPASISLFGMLGMIGWCRRKRR